MEHRSFGEIKRETRAGREYTLRPFRRGDEGAILALYEAVWGERCTADWFDWRYLENPYIEYVPMLVIETAGTVVGTRPFLVLPMRVGSGVRLALQSVDTMVHPDHRRRGLFSWMTAEAVRYFVRREPAFVFNQPNAAARAGFLELGWREVGPMVTFYRIQRPGALLGARRRDSVGSLIGGALWPAAAGYLRAKDRLATRTTAYTLESVDDVPADQLTAAYRRHVPRAIHAHRDETYYRWRFASPAWDRTTYRARRGDEVVAGILTRTRETHQGVTVTQLADVVPLVGDRRWLDALTSLLGHIVDRHRSSDLIAAPARAFPAPLLTAFGFHPDDQLPLSALKSSDNVLVTRPLTPANDWAIEGLSLTDPENWLLAYGERDTI